MQADKVANGINFQKLATYRVTSGTLKVVLSNNANGYVIADAVQVDQGTPPISPLSDLHWSSRGVFPSRPRLWLERYTPFMIKIDRCDRYIFTISRLDHAVERIRHVLDPFN